MKKKFDSLTVLALAWGLTQHRGQALGGSSALKLKMLCGQLRGRIVQPPKKNFQKKSKKNPPPILHGRRKNMV